MKEQSYLPVNWTDGMKINKSHFLAQDNAVTCQLSQNTSSLLNEYNYGLLPAVGKNGPGARIFLNMDNQHVLQLRLQQCLAITRGGYLIQFDEDVSSHDNSLSVPFVQLSVPVEELRRKAVAFYVVISVNPYRRVPSGLADFAETPPRLPFTRPAFYLSLVPVQETGKNVIGLFQLPLGKLRIDGQRAALEDEYIPPCSAICSHYDLLQFQGVIEQFYGKMELYSLQIIQKILQKKQVNEMAGIVHKLCENIAVSTAAKLAEIRSLSIHEPPIYLINKVSSMARLIKNTLDYYIGSGKEELINYCTEWCSISQGQLEGCLTALTNQPYDHLDVNASFNKVSDFISVVTNLLSNLARLEYIGKRKEAGIFVKEQVIPNETDEPRRRKSFLAD